ncbi:MAG: hypothetical protein HYZ24_04230 [Chloroflexi bacterium]|nr:hypothetical protein [Chloroflexota bacterium]
MKTKQLIIGITALTLVLFGTAFLLRPALAGPLSALQQETPMPLFGTLTEVWAQFCAVSTQMSYVLLAIPEDATFEVVSPEGASSSQETTPTPEAASTPSTPEAGATSPGTSGLTSEEEVACRSLGMMDGQQLVLCHGPALTVITLSITSGGQTEEFPIMPPGCAAEFPGPTDVIPTETSVEEITPTVPVLPTESPEPSPSPVPPTP